MAPLDGPGIGGAFGRAVGRVSGRCTDMGAGTLGAAGGTMAGAATGGT